MGTVAVNPPKTPVTEGSGGVAVASLPNVCKLPGPPAPFVPTPLPNIGKSDDSPKGYSKTVTFDGHAVAIKGASFKSTGDAASQSLGGGVVSANTQGATKFLGPGSMDVKVEGKNVQLLGDPMINNCGPSGSPANSATMAGVVQAPAPVSTSSAGSAASTRAASPTQQTAGAVGKTVCKLCRSESDSPGDKKCYGQYLSYWYRDQNRYQEVAAALQALKNKNGDVSLHPWYTTTKGLTPTCSICGGYGGCCLRSRKQNAPINLDPKTARRIVDYKQYKSPSGKPWGTYFLGGSIASKGCFLTCLSMLLGFHGRKNPKTGKQPTPAELNTYLSRMTQGDRRDRRYWDCRLYQKHYTTYPAEQGRPEPTPRLNLCELGTARDPKLQGSKLQYLRKADPKKQHDLLDKVDELLDRRRPVMVDVVTRNTDLWGAHYLLIYGRDSNGRYLTHDPGWGSTFLDAINAKSNSFMATLPQKPPLHGRTWQYITTIVWLDT